MTRNSNENMKNHGLKKRPIVFFLLFLLTAILFLFLQTGSVLLIIAAPSMAVADGVADPDRHYYQIAALIYYSLPFLFLIGLMIFRWPRKRPGLMLLAGITAFILFWTGIALFSQWRTPEWSMWFLIIIVPLAQMGLIYGAHYYTAKESAQPK